MVNRRETLRLMGAGAATAGLGTAACGNGSVPLRPGQRWLAQLGQGIEARIDSTPVLEGVLPPDLSGTLYRNGPGLFERAGYRKHTLLDGDGMIRTFSFADGRVRFRTRFVATEKITREAEAGRFLFPTWTTPAPRFLANLPAIPGKSQAGVTAVVKSGKLYAFDEVGAPYTLDPGSLATTGQVAPGERLTDGPRAYKAHTKTDAASGVWVLTGTSGQPRQQLHTLVLDRDGRTRAHAQTPNLRGDYFHDFFWTGRHVVFHLHPAPLSPWPMLMGLRTFVESLSWRPELGSRLVVVDPAGASAPLTLEVPPAWMWHSVNAYEDSGSIIADFVGYDAPDHFFGPRAVFRTVMTGEEGVARSPGTLRRLVIDLAGRRARLATLLDKHLEFPTTSPLVQGRPYRFAYCAIGDIDRSWFHDGVAKIDTATGRHEEFRFGPDRYVGEPVFAPQPGAFGEDDGWLLCEVLDGSHGRSELAVLDARAVAAGPVATVKLAHHLPFSFHGWWQGA